MTKTIRKIIGSILIIIFFTLLFGLLPQQIVNDTTQGDCELFEKVGYNVSMDKERFLHECYIHLRNETIYSWELDSYIKYEKMKEERENYLE